MFKKFITETPFPLLTFLKELDRKHLLFIHFIVNSGEDMSEIFDGDVTFDKFMKVIKNSKTPINRLKRDILLGDLVADFTRDGLGMYILEAIYYDSVPIEVDFECHEKIEAIMQFTKLMFWGNLAGKNVGKLDLKGDFDDVLDKYFINNKIATNVLGAVMLLGYLDRFDDIEDVLSKGAISEFRSSLLERILYFINKSNLVEMESFFTMVSAIRDKENDMNKKLDEKQSSLTKVRENLKKSNSENKELLEKLKGTLTLEEKEKEDSELVKQLYGDIRKKDEQLQRLTNDLKNIKDKPSNMYKSMIEGLNSSVSELKLYNNNKTNEIRVLKKKVMELEQKDIRTIILDYFNNNEVPRNIVDDIYSKCKEVLNEKENIFEEEVAITKLEEIPNIRSGYKIGYCIIENNKHYISFFDNTKVDIVNLPLTTYIGDNQFVLVDENNNFKWAYSYRYDKYDNDYLINSIGAVVFKNGDTLLDKGDNTFVKVNRIPYNATFREKQVIALDNKDNFGRFFKGMRYSADSFLNSIKAKGHRAVFVLKIFPNGTLLRDIETDEEFFSVLNQTEKQVKEQQVICICDGEVINVFNSHRFYTLSSYYSKAEHGTVELKEGVIFAKKLSGEVVIVSDTPSQIELANGNVIYIDENNNYLEIKRDETPISEIKRTSPQIQNRRNNSVKIDKVDTIKNVLIIGNKSYENSYKLSLYKSGYKTEVIDGYEISWTKINSSIKESDIVIIVTTHCSHDNMWKVKENVTDKPVLYPAYDGANRILDEILKLDNQQNIG